LNRDIKLITIISAIFGLSSGMFGILFTLYLDDLNVSLSTIGAIFSVSGLLSFFAMIFVGVQSDVWGRKIVYSVSLLLAAISRFLMPWFTGVGELTIVKIVQDYALKARTAIHPMFVFEHVKEGYAKLIARIQGIELIFSATGSLIVGSILLFLGYQGSFISLGLILFVAFIIFQFVRESSWPKVERKSIKEMYSFDISRQLKLICGLNFLHGTGFSISHSVFIYTLFFRNKFALDPLTLSLVLGLHHFAFGPPMLILSRIFDDTNLNYKKVTMIGTLLTGAPMIISVFIPSLIPAFVIWLLHDVIGASIRAPALSPYAILRERRKSRKGHKYDVSLPKYWCDNRAYSWRISCRR